MANRSESSIEAVKRRLPARVLLRSAWLFVFLSVTMGSLAMIGAAQTADPAPAADPLKAAEARTGPVIEAPPAAAPAAQTAPPEAPKPVPQPPPKRKSNASAESTPEQPTAKPYVIGPLDVLGVSVWGNPNLSHMVDVRTDGMISMALIGEVKADGLTVEQLKDVLKKKLSDFINEPEIDIQVAKINSKQFYIAGEVGRTGAFPLIQPTTVLEALTAAGGFREFANTKKIYILRGKERFNFNYKDVSQGKHLEQDIQLQNGDRIFVP